MTGTNISGDITLAYTVLVLSNQLIASDITVCVCMGQKFGNITIFNIFENF